MRITPELKEQLEAEAGKDNVSLANWIKDLARQELKRRGIEPKGWVKLLVVANFVGRTY